MTWSDGWSDAIAADPLWAELDAEFRTVKGVVARLMAELPEIGTLGVFGPIAMALGGRR